MWGVYALLMFKLNHAFKLYIGSGTNSERGALVRLPHHHVNSSYLARFVKKAFADGHEAQHIGLLCWTLCLHLAWFPKFADVGIRNHRNASMKATGREWE